MKIVIAVITILLIFLGTFLDAIGITVKEDTMIFFTLEVLFGIIFYLLYIFSTFQGDKND